MGTVEYQKERRIYKKEETTVPQKEIEEKS